MTSSNRIKPQVERSWANAVVHLTSHGTLFLDTGDRVIYLWDRRLINVDGANLRQTLNASKVIASMPWPGKNILISFKNKSLMCHFFNLDWAREAAIKIDENFHYVSREDLTFESKLANLSLK